jgi:hypothetical protein
MKADTTMDKDTVANVTTIAASGISLMSTETILTLFVLCSALVLNLVRIYSHIKEKKQ